MRGITVLWILVSSAVVVGLFVLKYQVQELEKELAGLNRQIYENQESVHVLRAEWTYLLDPTRLRELAEKHLNMKSVQPNQVAAALPAVIGGPRGQEDGVALAEAPAAAPLVSEARAERPQAVPTPRAARQASPAVRQETAPAARGETGAARTVADKPASTPRAPSPAPVATASAPVSSVTLATSQPRTQPATGDVLVIRSPALRAAETERGNR